MNNRISALSKKTLLDISPLERVLLVAFGAFLGGSLWRIRGEHGWGSMWGLLAVGFCFTLFIFSLYGGRKKLSPAALGTAAIAFMLTSPAWGTLNDQITGVIFDSMNNEIRLFINPLSGVFFMLCMGFATPVLFAYMLGRSFSPRQYRLREHLLILAIYFAVTYIARYTVAPLIVNLVEPQAAELFKIGLAEAGVEGSAYFNYIKYVFNEDGIRDFLGGRNYSACITAVAKMLATAAVLLVTRFRLKDRFAAKTAAVVCGAMAFAITATDGFVYIQEGGRHMTEYAQNSIPGWSYWEYFTGFFAALIITSVFVSKKFAQKVAENDPSDEFCLQKPSKANELYTFLVFCICGSASFVRPAIERFKDSRMNASWAYIIAAAALVFCFILCISKGFSLDRVCNCSRFYALTLGAFYLLYFLLYFFVLEKYEIFWDFSNPVNFLMFASSAAILMLSPVAFKLTAEKK